MQLDYRRIQGSVELKEFQAKVTEFIGVSFPFEFLCESEVYVGINSSGELCCGFLISKNSDAFRAIEGIPIEKRKIEACKLAEMVEVTGLWVLPEYRGALQTILLAHFISATLRQTKRNLGLLTYSSSNIRLGRLYQLLEGEVVYSGETLQLEGMDKVDEETVICFEIEKMGENLIRKFQRWSSFIGVSAA